MADGNDTSNDPSHGDGSQGVEVVKDTAKENIRRLGGSSATPPASSAGVVVRAVAVGHY